MYQPKAWDILLVKWVSRLSKAIRRFTKWRYNHAGVFVEVWWKMCIVEAERNWVRMKYSWEEYKERSWREFAILESKKVTDRDVWLLTLPFVWAQKYDFLSLLIYQPIYQLTGRWFWRKNDWENRFYCSEFAAYIWNELFWILDEWYKISPQDLYRYALNNNINIHYV